MLLVTNKVQDLVTARDCTGLKTLPFSHGRAGNLNLLRLVATQSHCRNNLGIHSFLSFNVEIMAEMWIEFTVLTAAHHTIALGQSF